MDGINRKLISFSNLQSSRHPPRRLRSVSAFPTVRLSICRTVAIKHQRIWVFFSADFLCAIWLNWINGVDYFGWKGDALLAPILPLKLTGIMAGSWGNLGGVPLVPNSTQVCRYRKLVGPSLLIFSMANYKLPQFFITFKHSFFLEHFLKHSHEFCR